MMCRNPYEAAYAGITEAVQEHLDAGFDVNARDGHGCTLLHETVGHGYENSEMVAFLLSKGVDVHAVDNKKRTALHYATNDGLASTKLILDAGAKIDALDANQETPLHLCIREEHNWDCAGYLILQGANHKLPDRFGTTPEQMLALKKSDPKAFEDLVWKSKH